MLRSSTMRARHGITLLEVLISMGILTIGLASGLAGMFLGPVPEWETRQALRAQPSLAMQDRRSEGLLRSALRLRVQVVPA